jgi:WD40 repeat protein
MEDDQASACLASFRGHTSSVFSLKVARDQSAVLVSAASDGVKLWDIRSGECFRQLEAPQRGGASCVAVDSEGKRIYASYADGSVACWDAGSGREVWSRNLHADDCRSVSLSADNQRLLSGSFDNTVRLVEADSGVVLASLHEHASKVTNVRWGPGDEGLFLSASADRTVRLWSVSEDEDGESFVS